VGRIAFLSDLEGADNLYVMDVQDGAAGALTRLTAGDEVKGFPIWSPDGACLAYQQYQGNVLELWVAGIDGEGPRRVAEGLVWGAGTSWAP
jgi:Tol biopolymer transport system component